MTEFIEKEYDGFTVKDYLSKILGFSHGMIKKCKFRENGITVNGSFVTVRYILRQGDTLSLLTEDREEDTCPYMIPADLPIGIAYEDADLTVVDKPAGMPAHPSLAHHLDTVANALAFRYSDEPFVFRPVNRLDRDTSGLMMTARTRLAAYTMYGEMIKGKIQKMYVAICENAPMPENGFIEAPIRRVQGSIMEREVTEPDDEKGKYALTKYRTVCKSGIYSVVLAAPVTGRTHQIRVHFSHIGCPLLGDTMYGGNDKVLPRHALHATYLAFTRPDGKYCELYSPMPDDMRKVIGDGDIDEKIKSAIAEMQNDGGRIG